MRVGSELANRKTEVFGWGSWTVWSKKRGERGGGGSGAGRGWVLLEWSRKGGSREGGREWGRGGWVEWEGGQGRVNCEKQIWLVFLDRVEQEGTGAGGGGEWGWGGLGGVEGGPKHGPFGGTWWECASVLNCPKQKNGRFWLGSWTGWSRKGGGAGGGREWGRGGWVDWEGGPTRGAFDETSWACAFVLNCPTEKRKFLVGVPGQCGARKGGSGGGGGEWGRGGWVLSRAGVGAGGLGGVGGWSSAEVLVGPKTETRKFLVGVPGQGGAGRDGSGGGAGVGLGGGVGWSGRGVPSTDLLWDLVGMRVGSRRF